MKGSFLMQITESKIVATLSPCEGNPRNSEGCFLRLDDGRIAFAYSRYIGDSAHDHAACQIACIYSHDNGESFDTEHIETLVNAEEYGEQNVMSVTLRRMDNGDIGLFYLLKLRDGGLRSHYYMRRYRGDFSHPCGEVQVAPVIFPGYYVINNDRVVRLENGRWIVPASLHPTPMRSDESADPARMDSRGSVFCFASDDDGYHWSPTKARLDLNSPYSRTGLQEPGLVELPGGTLYGYFRTDRMYQYESVSLDHGDRWFTPQPSAFSSPASPMLIKKNPFNDRYYAVWNPIPEYPGRPRPDGYWIGGRTPLVLADSADGYKFEAYREIETDPTCGFCYPAVEFLDENTLLLAYCSGGKEEGGCLNRVTVRKIILTH